MAKHTPGPWSIREKDKTVVAYGPNGASGLVAKAMSTGSASGGTLESHHSAACANARLIALAPEMMQALELIADAEDRGIITVKAYGDMEPNLRQRVLNAIAFVRRLPKSEDGAA